MRRFLILIFASGRGFLSVVLVALVLILSYAIFRASRGKLPKIKSFPAIEAIPEAVGRAAEMGKPIHLSPAFGGMHDARAPMTIAGLAILSRVAEEAAKRGVSMRFNIARSHMVPVVEELMKSAYAKAGKPEGYTPDIVYYVGETQAPYQAAVMGYMYREKPAASFLFGPAYYEAITILGSAAVIGAFQIAGTAREFYQGYVIATCDYSLILDELYAAAAAITKKPEDMGSIAGLDDSKLLTMALIVLSAILGTAGISWWQALVKW